MVYASPHQEAPFYHPLRCSDGIDLELRFSKTIPRVVGEKGTTA
jgi:hypothetical protein